MTCSLVLLPTYNERENLLRVLPRLSALEDEVDVLVIDDSSPDGTGELADELTFKYARLSVLHRKKKEGLGRAYVHGFREALQRGYTRVVTMDADLSHAPEDVPRLLRALEQADVAIGSRHVLGGGVESWPLSRQLLSRAGSLYARTLLGLAARDVTSGFRAYRAEAVQALDLDLVSARGFVFQIEMLKRILDLPGARALEVPILFRNRVAGQSKLSRGIIGEAAWEVAKLALRRRFTPAARSSRSDGPHRREPSITVVVPARPDAEEPAAVGGVDHLDYPREKLNVLIARGCSPSRQRNEAVKWGHGELILFLDDDSIPAPDLLTKYLAAFRSDPQLGAVGGPAETSPGGAFQGLAALVLGEGWVMGKTASRYRARGEKRLADERELILCNLCVRRSAFEEAGGFNESLYPNEENEFLGRLQRLGWRLLHDPAAVVERPQRATARDLLSAVHRYGQGRAAQLRCGPSMVSMGRMALVLGALTTLSGAALSMALRTPILFVPCLLYFAYLFCLSVKLSFRAGMTNGILAALLASLVHVSYAVGVVRGVVRRFPAARRSEVRLECLDVKAGGAAEIGAA